jgi:hypothetical protein
MTEIGPLLLPPPTATSGRPGAPVRLGAGRVEARDEQAALPPVEAAADATGGPRAKQFRFRVVDGGRSDTLGNAEVPAQSRSAAEAGTGSAAGRIGGETPAGKSAGLPLGTFSTPFLAQLIAQEQLAPGLYNPPIKSADRAYRQAGAEPPLTDDEFAPARFKIAV